MALFPLGKTITTLVLAVCVLGVEPDVTASSSVPQKALQVSLDGTCGDGVTCIGSNWGQCCSEHGYCGNSEAYCGIGCHSDFGACVADDEAPSLAACPAPIENVTRTTTVTSTEWVAVTETRPPAGWVQGTREVTRVVPVTSTAVVTSTRYVNRIETLTAAITVNVTKVSTSLNIVHETSTSTRLFRTTSTSLVVETSTNIINKTNIVATTYTLTITANLTQPVCSSSSAVRSSVPLPSTSTHLSTIARGPPWRRPPASASTTTATVTVPAAATTTLIPSSTTAAQAPSVSPTLRGMTTECKKFYKTVDDDNCSNVMRKERITGEQIIAWNPSLAPRNARDLCEWETIKQLQQGLCKMDCSDLWPGYYLCVGV